MLRECSCSYSHWILCNSPKQESTQTVSLFPGVPFCTSRGVFRWLVKVTWGASTIFAFGLSQSSLNLHFHDSCGHDSFFLVMQMFAFPSCALTWTKAGLITGRAWKFLKTETVHPLLCLFSLPAPCFTPWLPGGLLTRSQLATDNMTTGPEAPQHPRTSLWAQLRPYQEDSNPGEAAGEQTLGSLKYGKLVQCLIPALLQTWFSKMLNDSFANNGFALETHIVSWFASPTWKDCCQHRGTCPTLGAELCNMWWWDN